MGAWWLGFLIGGVTSFLAAIPFCFLPKSLKKPEEANNDKASYGLLENMGATRKILPPAKPKPRKCSVVLKGKCFASFLNVKSNRHNVQQECNSSAEYFASPALQSKPVSYPQERRGPLKIIRSQRASSRLWDSACITCNASLPEWHLRLKFCARRNLNSGKIVSVSRPKENIRRFLSQYGKPNYLSDDHRAHGYSEACCCLRKIQQAWISALVVQWLG